MSTELVCLLASTSTSGLSHVTDTPSLCLAFSSLGPQPAHCNLESMTICSSPLCPVCLVPLGPASPHQQHVLLGLKDLRGVNRRRPTAAKVVWDDGVETGGQFLQALTTTSGLFNGLL